MPKDTCIEIERPLQLRFDLIQLLDALYPEILVQVDYRWSCSGEIHGSVNVWYGKAEWLTFIQSLREIACRDCDGIASLIEQNCNVVICMKRTQGKLVFSLEHYISRWGHEPRFWYAETINEEVFASFRDAFVDFPLWWREKS